jgi:hypothetical protein
MFSAVLVGTFLGLGVHGDVEGRRGVAASSGMYRSFSFFMAIPAVIRVKLLRSVPATKVGAEGDCECNPR